jgi:RNA polymerase sigma-70 factor (ECF subfamily)
MSCEDLIARYYDGDDLAFEPVHKEWFPRLCVFFRYFGIEPADAEDLALMSLFKVARTAVRGGRFERGEGRPFAAWIHRIARNSMLDFIRRRPPEVLLADLAGEDDDGPPLEESLFRQAASQETDLARVKPENRQALILYYLEEQTLEEVAALGETSVPTAWRRVQRGRRELYQALTSGRQPASEAAHGPA